MSIANLSFADVLGQITSFSSAAVFDFLGGIKDSIRADFGMFNTLPARLRALKNSKFLVIQQESVAVLASVEAMQADVAWLVDRLQTLGQITPGLSEAVNMVTVYTRMKMAIDDVEDMEQQAGISGAIAAGPSSTANTVLIIGAIIFALLLLRKPRKNEP